MAGNGERNLAIWIGGWSALLSAGVGLMWTGQFLIGLFLSVIGAIGLFALREPPQKPRAIERYTKALLVMVIITWATLATNLGYEVYSRYFTKQPRVFDSLFVLWGSDLGSSCSAIIDGSKIKDLQDKYRVALICGFTDPTADRMKDTRITVTRTYTIENGNIPMSASYSKDMAEEIKDMITNSRVKAPILPPGFQVQVNWSPSWDAVALPKDVEASDIHTLSDVRDHGGEILQGVSVQAVTVGP